MMSGRVVTASVRVLARPGVMSALLPRGTPKSQGRGLQYPCIASISIDRPYWLCLLHAQAHLDSQVDAARPDVALSACRRRAQPAAQLVAQALRQLAGRAVEDLDGQAHHQAACLVGGCRRQARLERCRWRKRLHLQSPRSLSRPVLSAKLCASSCPDIQSVGKPSASFRQSRRACQTHSRAASGI